MANRILLEVPVFSQTSADSVIHSDHGRGTSRLELNAQGSYPQGGTTPVQTTYHHALTRSIDTPLRIMIRPRGPPDDGSPDFVYSDDEFDRLMVQAVLDWKASGTMSKERGDGFVFGVLREKVLEEDEATTGPALVVDVDRCLDLVQLAAPYPCVFHRAFDDILGTSGSTVQEALADLILCGFTGLLTSGGPGRAVDNIDTVARIISAAPEGLREVIVGGGVRSSNVKELAEVCLPRVQTRAGLEVWFHSSCLTAPAVSDAVDVEELRLIVERVKGLSCGTA